MDKRSTPEPGLSIPKISSDTLSYDDFFERYMLPNRPVIITDVSQSWTCVKKWLKANETAIDFDSLRQHLKDRLVPVANCSKQHFNSHEKSETHLHKYLDWWEKYAASNHQLEDNNEELLYLKDWHLQQEEGDAQFYKVPVFFQSDWLNEYLLESKKQDYRFVYMGPKGSWTPFHSDVYSSFSWSTNIVGMKRWIFLAAGDEKQLLDKNSRLPFSIDAAELRDRNISYFELFQGPNEAVFVPSGWFHQVWNLEDTISVNHNWFNGTHVEQIWNALRTNLGYVIDELASWDEVQESEEHYQVMLKASFGMNFSEFVDILEFIFHRRLNGVGGHPEGEKYLQFDMDSIHRLVEKMLEQEEDQFTREDLHRLDEIKVTVYK